MPVISCYDTSGGCAHIFQKLRFISGKRRSLIISWNVIPIPFIVSRVIICKRNCHCIICHYRSRRMNSGKIADHFFRLSGNPVRFRHRFRCRNITFCDSIIIIVIRRYCLHISLCDRFLDLFRFFQGINCFSFCKGLFWFAFQFHLFFFFIEIFGFYELVGNLRSFIGFTAFFPCFRKFFLGKFPTVGFIFHGQGNLFSEIRSRCKNLQRKRYQ